MSAVLQALQQHLAHEAEEMRAFIDLLDEETRALSTPDAGAALGATTARKHAHAAHLNALAQTRAMLLAELGFADVGADLSPIVHQYPHLRPAIERLINVATQARAQNQQNGVAIQTLQRHHQEALNALRVLAGGEKNRLYDARGRSTRASRSAAARRRTP